jgi:hypothetical protein
MVTKKKKINTITIFSFITCKQIVIFSKQPFHNQQSKNTHTITKNKINIKIKKMVKTNRTKNITNMVQFFYKHAYKFVNFKTALLS